ncbi:hypothetical protein WA026_010728 [Henosepilachna vigintioctopunctata]|uniref:Uncharacterized protein n=1 Tax=Henosepilachna vigintioctopunctata TaxID=420089 RepID=A0AAW1UVU2_9CUCU
MSMKIKLFIVLFFAAGLDCTERCVKCEDTNLRSFCRYGGSRVDTDDDCPSGKSTCYYMKYTLANSGQLIFKRGCDSSNFCDKQKERRDIEIQRCLQCDGDFCNRGSLA